MSARRAFTLIETLAVILMIAVLAGILLPAINKVRTSADITTCRSRMSQLALAVQNYHQQHAGELPPLVDLAPTSPSGLKSLHFRLLPYLDQASIYQLYNPNTPATYNRLNPNPPGAATRIVKQFICPDDPSAPGGTHNTTVVTTSGATPFAPPGYYATTSYVANGSVFVPSATINSIVDNKSRTIMFAERYQVSYTKASGISSVRVTDPVAYTLWGLGSYSAQMASFATRLLSGTPTVPTSPLALNHYSPNSPVINTNIAGYFGTSAIAAYGTFGNQVNTQAPSGFQVVPGGNIVADARIPQTGHISGMIVAYADGSVQTIRPNIAAVVFWAMVTPAGNENLTNWN